MATVVAVVAVAAAATAAAAAEAGAGLVEPPPLVAMTTSGSTRQAPSISMSARRGFWGLAPCSKGGDSAPSSSLGCRQLSTERSVSSAPKPCSGWVSSLHTSTPSISSTVSCAACLGRDAFAVGAFAVGASPSLSLSILRARRARASCAVNVRDDPTDVLRFAAVLYAQTRRPQTA
eukprot:scaffold30604_cov63-Phaeocystis_antarctica.AAC.1